VVEHVAGRQRGGQRGRERGAPAQLGRGGAVRGQRGAGLAQRGRGLVPRGDGRQALARAWYLRRHRPRAERPSPYPACARHLRRRGAPNQRLSTVTAQVS